MTIYCPQDSANVKTSTRLQCSKNTCPIIWTQRDGATAKLLTSIDKLHISSSVFYLDNETPSSSLQAWESCICDIINRKFNGRTGICGVAMKSCCADFYQMKNREAGGRDDTMCNHGEIQWWHILLALWDYGIRDVFTQERLEWKRRIDKGERGICNPCSTLHFWNICTNGNIWKTVKQAWTQDCTYIFIFYLYFISGRISCTPNIPLAVKRIQCVFRSQKQSLGWKQHKYKINHNLMNRMYITYKRIPCLLSR